MQSLLRLVLCISLCLTAATGSRDIFSRYEKLKAGRDRRHLERAKAEIPTNTPMLEKRASPFANSKTQKFAVDGTGIPEVPFDVGESYAGLLPISNATDETRELFFWFFPSANEEAKNEITIWLQGGPGASSLFGLLFENGPFIWQAGTLSPTPNPYSWNNLTNMVWVDQPVGVGFSQGKPDIKNEVQLAEQFMGFFKNFVETFSMQGYKVYITGESYGGYYVPYIANAFLEAEDTTYYNLKGVSINDPIIGDPIIQFEGVAVQYLNYWSNVFDLNSTFMARINAANTNCGYPAYLEKYFKFPPPKGPFPVLYGIADLPRGCDVQDSIIAAITELNPCFNEDHIFDTCPNLYSSIGPYNVEYSPPGAQVYFNRADVKRVLHVPVDTVWMLEADINVFVGPPENYTVAYRDDSLPPATNGVLKNVIEKTNNTIIGVGGLDFQLPANGTLWTLQNITWNGMQGFQEYPDTPLYVPYHPEYNLGAVAGAGYMGQWRSERGLTFYTVHLAGHEGPWYAPGAAYRVLETLLGRIPNLGTTGDFTTQKGQFTGHTPLYR